MCSVGQEKRSHLKNLRTVMLVPVKITRSMLILESAERLGQLHNKVSLSFIATFTDGTQKILNQAEWEPASLTKAREIGPEHEVVVAPNVCALYHKDWSNVESGAENWRKCYPKPIPASKIPWAEKCMECLGSGEIILETSPTWTRTDMCPSCKGSGKRNQ